MGAEGREPHSSCSPERWNWPETSALSPLPPVLYSRSPASLLGERSSLRSALALQKEKSFKNPQKRELWEKWRCIYSPVPQAQKGLLLSGTPRA